MLFQNEKAIYQLCLVAVEAEEAKLILNTPLDDTVLISVFCYSTVNWTALPQSIPRFLHS